MLLGNQTSLCYCFHFIMATRNFNTNTATRQSMASSGGAVKARQLVCPTLSFSTHLLFFVLTHFMMGLFGVPGRCPLFCPSSSGLLLKQQRNIVRR